MTLLASLKVSLLQLMPTCLKQQSIRQEHKRSPILSSLIAKKLILSIKISRYEWISKKIFTTFTQYYMFYFWKLKKKRKRRATKLKMVFDGKNNRTRYPLWPPNWPKYMLNMAVSYANTVVKLRTTQLGAFIHLRHANCLLRIRWKLPATNHQ